MTNPTKAQSAHRRAPVDTDTHMRTVLLELTLLMHGSTSSWNPTTSGTRDRDPRPPGDSYPVAEQYRDRYTQALGDIARRRVLHEARAELQRWRGHGIQRHAGETQDAVDARMVAEGKGWTVAEVARAFSCTSTRVRRACAHHGVTVDYQDRLAEADAMSRASLAQTMHAAGRTQQQIADVLGIHQCNVSRLLKTVRKQAA